MHNPLNYPTASLGSRCFSLWLLRMLIVSLVLITSLSSCTQTANYTPLPPANQPAEGSGSNPTTIDETQVLSAQQQQAEKVEVTCTLPVKKLLPDDTKGLPHQRFLLSLSNGSTILVAHDTAMAPKVPLAPGDLVTIRGEYIWNAKGGVIHWTHHTDTPRHEGGYIDYQSRRYQ